LPSKREDRVAATLAEAALICEIVAVLLQLSGGEEPSTVARLLALGLGLAAALNKREGES
jgi:hypothetical protein